MRPADLMRLINATVKREIEAVKAQGRIEFVGPTKTGCYRLTKTAGVG